MRQDLDIAHDRRPRGGECRRYYNWASECHRFAAGAPGYGDDVSELCLFPHLDCIDNVAFSLKMRGTDKVARRARARELLRLVAVDGYAERAAGAIVGRPTTKGCARPSTDHRTSNFAVG
jgi:hypothetical protein